MILVFGETGQVACELRAFPDVLTLNRNAADLSNPKSCAAAILHHKPTAVINAAAYTAVDRAEEDETLATIINGDAPAEMAYSCAALAIPFVTISTDYVFAGNGTKPWQPDDATAPLGAYGRSKLAGEIATAKAAGTWAVLRTSWVVSAHGNNFVKTMLHLGAQRDTLNIVADQIGGPTPARDIAAACHKMAHALMRAPEKSGMYHFSGTPDISWAGFAREIFAQASIDCDVTDIPSSAYPTPAARPLNSRLDCTTIKAVFDINRPDWHSGLAGILKELGEN